MLSARTSRVQHFNTPKTPVWGHISARAAVKGGGTCKAIVCDHCEKEFAGGSLRITEHYAKCKSGKSVPVAVKEWAVDKLGRSAAKRQGKEAVKKRAGGHVRRHRRGRAQTWKMSAGVTACRGTAKNAIKTEGGGK
jgi:hypothetical protein